MRQIERAIAKFLMIALCIVDHNLSEVDRLQSRILTITEACDQLF